MAGQPMKSVPNRPKGEPWAVPYPREAVLIGEESFIREAEVYFAGEVRDMALRTLSTEEDPGSALPPGFPIAGPWCLICDLVTSHRSLRIARKILLNTTNVPFFAVASEPVEIAEEDLRGLLELGIAHVLPVPASWSEAWAEIRKGLDRRLNPVLSVHSTKMWLVGVLQSVATEERNSCVRISSRRHGKSGASQRDHGTSLRVSPVGLLGEIYFREGQPVYAWSTRLQGDEAIIDLLQTSNVQISVLDSLWMPPARNVRSPLQGVLLEFMRRKDLGQLETPAGLVMPEDAAESEGGPLQVPSTKSAVAAASPASPERPFWAHLGLVWGGVSVVILAAVLLVLLRSPGAPDPPAPAGSGIPASVPRAATVPASDPAPAAPARPPDADRAPRSPSAPVRDLVLPLGDRVNLEAVLIPAGRFRMGTPDDERGRENDEGPVHEVVFGAPFYMGRFEVTQEQYEAVMGQNPSQFRGARRPVESVTSFEAQEFCERASKRAGREVRLPTGAEWEYACRAGSAAAFAPGASLRPGEANFDGRSLGRSSEEAYRGKTLEVGSFAPNAFGLYDMHGNVGEWCLDFYDSLAYLTGSRAPVPFSPARPERVWRGGAYADPPRRCRSGSREHYNAGGRDGFRGFRVAIPLDPPPVLSDPH